MKIIRAYSYKCADGLTKQLNENNEKRRLYYYAFQIILGGIFKFILLILLTIITQSFLETFSVLAFYAAYRVVAGGYHMDDYTNCMIVSFVMFIGQGLLLKFTYSIWPTVALWAFTGIVAVLALYVAIKYAPADTPFKPMDNPVQRKRLKRISVIVTCLWLIIDIVLLIKGYTFPVLAGCLGMLTGSFIVSPAGYHFFDFISGRMHRLRKRSAAG